MGYRRQAREAALGFLYQQDFGYETKTSEPKVFLRHFGLSSALAEFYIAIVEGVSSQQEQLDQEIQAVAEHWKINRMKRVDRCILRIGCWELMNAKETPTRVVIDEAVEVAKKYSTNESASFVNGLLDQLARRHRTG